MKFDSFVKYCGSDGTILTRSNGENWLFLGGVGMMIPEGRGVIGKMYTMPEYMESMISFDDYEPAELVGASVPRADSKPSELMREFSDDEISILIPNKVFGFIEKKDQVFINELDHEGLNGEEKNYRALLITDDYGDDIGFKMMYIEEKKEEE